MKILMETEHVQTDTFTEIRRCARCPQELYIQRNAKAEAVAADIESHLKICPGRANEQQAA